MKFIDFGGLERFLARLRETFAPLSHTHAASQVTGLTESRALVSDASGHPAASAVTATELGYLEGVTSGVQAQLDGKAAASHTHAASSITSGTLPVERGGTGVTSDDALRQKVLDYPDNDDLLEYLGLS